MLHALNTVRVSLIDHTISVLLRLFLLLHFRASLDGIVQMCIYLIKAEINISCPFLKCIPVGLYYVRHIGADVLECQILSLFVIIFRNGKILVELGIIIRTGAKNDVVQLIVSLAGHRIIKTVFINIIVSIRIPVFYYASDNRNDHDKRENYYHDIDDDIDDKLSAYSWLDGIRTGAFLYPVDTQRYVIEFYLICHNSYEQYYKKRNVKLLDCFEIEKGVIDGWVFLMKNKLDFNYTCRKSVSG